MVSVRYLAVAMALAALAPAGVAQAKDGSTNTRVTASIPEVCGFSAPVLLADTSAETASAFAYEACNARRSYAITATTRLLDGGEAIALRFDGQVIDLASGGVTQVARRTGPTFMRVPISLQVQSLDAPVTVALSMTLL